MKAKISIYQEGNPVLELNDLINESNSVLIADFDNDKISFSHNADKPFKSASVIKIYVLAYYMYIGAPLDKVYHIDKKQMIGTSVITEQRLTEVRLDYMLKSMIGMSDNTATNVLFAEATFEKLNAFIKEVIGTENTVIARKMLDYKAVEEGRDNLTSLSDVYKAMKFLWKYDFARECLRSQKCLERIGRYFFDNSITLYLKSGSIPLVFNDVGILEKGGRHAFAGVLTYGEDKNSKAKRLCGVAGLKAAELLK